VRKASDVEIASLDVRRLGLSQPMIQSHPIDPQRKHTAAMNAKHVEQHA
jgi:propanediol utilization protein